MLSVKIGRELREMRGAEMLIIDMFGNDVQQPSPCRDVIRALHRPILTLFFFATSLDNAFHAGKSLHDSCSIRVQKREDIGKGKFRQINVVHVHINSFI